MSVHVFESPKRRHAPLIWFLAKMGRQVFVIEPFYAYHHEHGIRFNPQEIPKSIQNLIQNGFAKLLPAKELGARENYCLASDLAVEAVEKVFPTFRSGHESWIQYLCRVFKSNDAELIFKKVLCDQLAVFYSVNSMLQHTQKKFNSSVTAYIEMNPSLYQYLKKILTENKLPVFDDSQISFSVSSRLLAIYSKILELRFRLFALAYLILLSPISWFMNLFKRLNEVKKFTYAIALVSPKRQITGEKNLRGVDFLVDGVKIKKEETVLIPNVSLNSEQKKLMEAEDVPVFFLPSKIAAAVHASRFLFRILFLPISPISLQLTQSTLFSLIAFCQWDQLLSKAQIKHYITHSDFEFSHIARNLVLKQKGIETWYFQDAVNTTLNFYDTNGEEEGKHPFWTYLYYDHLIAWTELHADFFRRHPGASKKIEIVGCLWADHIFSIRQNERKSNEFVILAFDSTYTRNSFTSYQEGIHYAQDLLRLADDIPNVKILFKEKRQRQMHEKVDTILGKELLGIYQKLSDHPRIVVALNTKDHAEMVMSSDLIISFPFTSTTFESLAANRPAIWHDAAGYYNNTLYGRVKSVTTSGYEDLKSKVLNVSKDSGRQVLEGVEKNVSLFDPYKDGKAIERFRNLLTGVSSENSKQHSYAQSVN